MPEMLPMGIMQTQNVGKNFPSWFQNNSSIPPPPNACFINDLPPELLSRIFEFGVADDDDEHDTNDEWCSTEHLSRDKRSGVDDADSDGSDVEMTETHKDVDAKTDEDDDSDATGSSDCIPQPPFQIVVSHVCHHWRDVALATPSLWTTIFVSPGARPPYQNVTTMLERSKGLPIDIYIECDVQKLDFAPSSNRTFLKILYDLLTPHIRRWRTIEISVSAYRDMFAFLSTVSDPSISAAPQLTSLQLYHHEEQDEFDSFGYPSMSRHLVLFGGSAPCLTNVVLWGVHVDWDQLWIASASNLVDLELAFHGEDVRPSWAQLATILRGAPSLEKLSLRMSGPSGEPPDWIIEPTAASPPDLNAPISLPKVTDFILAFHSQPRAVGLLQRLALPALKHLVLDFENNNDYTDLVQVLAGPATSSSPPSPQEQPRSLLSNLEGLKIAGLPCRPEYVETLYGELQNLTSLNVSLYYLPQKFLDLLCVPCTFPGRGEIWLPRLTTLYVTGTSGEVIRDVVEKRKSAGIPLQSLYVEESCDLEDEDVDWLMRNLKTFEFFEGSDDEDVIDLDDFHESEEIDEWSDID